MAARLLVRCATVIVAAFASCLLAFAQDAPRTLTTASELRVLSADEAKLPYPVRLRATVTLVEPGRTIFLRDETGATFLRGGNEPLRSGQQIEVEGETYPGLYLTGVITKRVTVLGEGPMPAPLTPNYEQLASGQFHYDWVEVRGIVRSASVTEEYTMLKLALGDAALDVFTVTADTTPVESLVDATVRVTGIAAGFINDRRQLVAPHLRVRSLADVVVLQPAPPEPEITPAAQLLRFAPGGRAGHRVKVRGVVMHHEPGAAVYLRDEAQGLRVRTATIDLFRIGEIVEALGFPKMGRLSAELEDAIVRRTGETAEIPAIPTTVKELFTGKHDGDLVQVEAEVGDVVRDADRLTLAMQSEDGVFLASVRGADAEAPDIGARVRLTGICRVVEATQPTRSYNVRARTFEILLRAPASDIVILRSPPWWNAQRLTIAASALLALALLSLAWVVLLRRQVTRQTALIRSQVETVAVADERQRIAREFHDTLEQELVGVSLRLDAAATRAEESKLRELLTATQRLVQQLQAGARNFVWNLREATDTSQPLAGAISAAVANLTAGRQVDVRTIGEPPRLSAIIRHELLRVAQEATTNAVKHGNAQHITITLEFEKSTTRLRIEDDGTGCNPDAPAPPGHFGLLGMRERVEKLGGTFAFHSAPGSGTTVEVTVPLT